MDSMCCKVCVYFRQHYILNEQRGTTVNCGHCIYPRIKHRSPESPACGHFEKREDPLSLPDQERVIDYLTTDVLRYILDLKLPPEIE